MKRLMLLAAFLAAAVSAKPAASVSPEQAIRQIETDWANAEVKADLAAIDRIEAPDWQLSDPEGNVSTKAEADADLKSGALKLMSFKIDDLKVRIFGDTAIVHGLETEKSSYKGDDTSGQYRFTDVFVKRGGVWRAVATHETRVVKH